MAYNRLFQQIVGVLLTVYVIHYTPEHDGAPHSLCVYSVVSVEIDSFISNGRINFYYEIPTGASAAVYSRSKLSRSFYLKSTIISFHYSSF